MGVRVALSSGFCEGVRRAFALAEKALLEGNPVFFLGELIHNRDAMAMLCAKGARVVSCVEDIPCGAVAITRSHGIPKDLAENLSARGVRVVDATCPKVKRVQVLAKQLEGEGYKIVILGERSHPEIQALLSYLHGEVTVVSEKSEWRRILQKGSSPVAVLAQTTFPGAIFREFADWAQDNALSWVHLVPTLCGETEARQRELEKHIAENPEDIVVVVGGKHSANTRSLFVLAQRKGSLVFWVENVEELKSLQFPSNRSFFVVSGTSTPDSIVAEVAAYLRQRV
ncbi:MAG: 4-hydroxy-3-methylbut-2-enyl diphosphate reductase [Atribacterota bacterium]